MFGCLVVKRVHSSEVQSQDHYCVATMMEAANKHLLSIQCTGDLTGFCLLLFIQRRVFCAPSVLERKMSTRQSREELIKKGVLKEVYEKGEGQEDGVDLSS